MRTIEEIKTDLSENNGMLLIQSVLTKEEKIKCLLKQIDLGNELIVAQDAEIARLRQQCAWQPIETDPDKKANARLVAAAPKMYELLEMAKIMFRDGTFNTPNGTEWAIDVRDLIREIDGQEDSHE